MYLYRLLIELFIVVRLFNALFINIFLKYVYLSKNVYLIHLKECNKNSQTYS